MSDKAYRISKVAADLNVSYQTLMERLIQKGFSVENKPTAKISDEMYQYLLTVFQSDKAAKEESKSLGLKLKKHKEELVKPEEPVVLKKKEEEPVKEEEEILVKNTTLTEVIEKSEELVKEEEIQTEKTERRKEELPGIKVLGKISLDKHEKKKPEKPIDPPAKPEEEKVVEVSKDEIVPEAQPIVEVPIVQETEITEVKEVTEETENAPEHIKTQFEKLQGLTIKGKIVLTETDSSRNKGKKKPIASSSDPTGADKKKRKRKTGPQKVKIEAEIKDNKRRPFGETKKEEPKAEITDKQIQDKIKATLSKIDNFGRGKNQKAKLKRQRRDEFHSSRLEEQERLEREQKVLKVTEFVSANELANMMSVSVTEIISTCFSLGLMVSINQRLDAETITIVADEFGYEVSFVDAEAQLAVTEEEDDPANLKPRPPIVTVMGHVDHGKTSLLDYVRSTNVIAGEAGGITQHIGAYEVTLKDGQKITFLDTPGHEAFTAMRARGAKVTDIAVIVIAADDSIMPQTREAISHAQAAGVPMIFAINKIDKDGANPEKIKEELANMNLLVEDWGGKYQCQEISAKKGINMDKLLEKILLEAELLQLTANPDRLAKGTVVEAKLDKGRGIVVNLLVQTGTLSIGDHVVAGAYYGKVKALFNERNQRTDKAGPSAPVMMLGFNGSPTAGDPFNVLPTEQEAKDLANKRFQLMREQGIRTAKHITLDEIGRRLAIGNFKELNLIVKGDVDGSVEALSDSLLKLSTDEIQVRVIHKGVGQITESDVLLATASDAIIVGFQVRPAAGARKLAETEQIDIRTYSVIYKAIEEIKAAMEGMLSPEVIEKVIGNVEVREVFKISKVGSIAGCMVTDGKITRNSKIRVIRDGVVMHSGTLSSLKRFKDDVKEVLKGFDCGVSVAGYNDTQIGDIIEVYEETEVQRKL